MLQNNTERELGWYVVREKVKTSCLILKASLSLFLHKSMCFCRDNIIISLGCILISCLFSLCTSLYGFNLTCLYLSFLWISYKLREVLLDYHNYITSPIFWKLNLTDSRDFWKTFKKFNSIFLRNYVYLNLPLLNFRIFLNPMHFLISCPF